MENCIRTNRIKWIDFCKCIAIFYMVWQHSGMPRSFVIYIFSFHMPIFFFLSGYTFNYEHNKIFSEFLIKKIKTIIVPYFIFGFISFVYCLCFCSKKIALLTINAMFCFNTDNIFPAGALWFLTCLFIVQILFYLIVSKTRNKKSILIILIAFSILGQLYSKFVKVRLPFGMDIALTAIVFYGAGYLLRNYSNFKNILNKYSTKIIYILFVILVNAILAFANGRVDMRLIKYNNYFLFYASSFLGIGSYIMLANYLYHNGLTNSRLNKLITFYGQNTMIILVLNQIVIVSSDMIRIRYFGHITGWGEINLVLTFIIFIPIIYLINNFCPFVIGKNRNTIYKKI